MSNNGAALDLSSTRSASPRRPQHRMSRSITDASAPTKQRHGHQHHHLPHLHQRRNQRDRNDRVPQSAAPTLQMPARASLDFPRSEGVTPYMLSSAEQSRRASMLFQGTEDIGTLATAAAAVREKQLQTEKERAASRTAGLKKSLTDLNTFSTDTMRRLDDTYYAVLEKLSTLQSTLVAMKELACMSQETKDVFRKDAQELVTEVETQLDSFGQFDEQEERIEALKSRILTGRQKVQSLSERMGPCPDTGRELGQGRQRLARADPEAPPGRLDHHICLVVCSRGGASGGSVRPFRGCPCVVRNGLRLDS
ncbi:hypothetical protein PG987_004426 [Apiospora arundinis]